MSDAMMAILACSATMAALTLLALLVSPLLERRYARGALYALWLAVMLGFLVPVRPAVPKTPVLRVELPQAMSEPLRRAPAAVAVNPGAQALTPQAANADVQDAGEQLSRASGGLRELAAGMLDALSRITPAQAFTALYLLGAALTLLVHGVRHVRFMRTVRRWERRVLDGVVREEYRWACDALGIRHGPQLYTCGAVSSPMLVGLVKPRILLPEGMAGDEGLSLVLRHELTHYRRHDLLLRVLMLLARAMHWFNPAVYICEHMAVHYGELSCDEQAVRGVGREGRAAYGQVILAALRRGERAPSALTTSFGADKRLLKKRLVAMMDTQLKRRGALAAVLALGLSAVLGGSFVLADGVRDAEVAANAAYSGIPEAWTVPDGWTVPEGASYGAGNVLATRSMPGAYNGGATFTLHDVYFDGYLMLVNTTFSPNAEGEGVYFDTRFSYLGGSPEALEARGLIPVGTYMAETLRTADGRMIEANYITDEEISRGMERRDAFVLSPGDAAQGTPTLCMTVGVIGDPTWRAPMAPGDWAEEVDIIVPVTQAAQVRELPLHTDDERLSVLRSALIAQTDRVVNIYIYYEGDEAPVGVKDGQNDVPGVLPNGGYDEARGMRYAYMAMEKGDLLEHVWLGDAGGRTIVLNLTDGSLDIQGEWKDETPMDPIIPVTDAVLADGVDAYALIDRIAALYDEYGNLNDWTDEQIGHAAQILCDAGVISRQNLDTVYGVSDDLMRMSAVLTSLLSYETSNLCEGTALALWGPKWMWTQEQKVWFTQLQDAHGFWRAADYLPYDEATAQALVQKSKERILRGFNIDLDQYNAQAYVSYFATRDGGRETKWRIVFGDPALREQLLAVQANDEGEIVDISMYNPSISATLVAGSALRANMTLEDQIAFGSTFYFQMYGKPGEGELSREEAIEIAMRTLEGEGFHFDAQGMEVYAAYTITGYQEAEYPYWHVGIDNGERRTLARVLIRPKTGEVIDVYMLDERLWDVPGLG